MTARDTRVVFVAGLSGSGRSTAMDALEDVGFYSVDNLPPPLVEQFLDLCAKSDSPRRQIALAIETREASFVAGHPARDRAAAPRGRAGPAAVPRLRQRVAREPLPRDAPRPPALARGLGRGGHRARARRCSPSSPRLADFVIDTTGHERPPAPRGGGALGGGRRAADAREPHLLRLPARRAPARRAALRRALPAEPALRARAAPAHRPRPRGGRASCWRARRRRA